MQITPHSPRPMVMIRRILVGLACALAFMVMASVFSPERTRAVGPKLNPTTIHRPLQPLPPEPSALDEWQSVDPHEGLQSLGAIEDRGYTIKIYATEVGPRYSVYDHEGRELGALLSEKQIEQAFPELRLPSMEFNANFLLMLAE